MATIPVNPERRDPGYLRKKADVGLSNVDNISATDFINVVSDDVKIVNNRKINSGKFSFEGKESYVGILKTARLNTHTNFSTGLFIYGKTNKELAQFNVDLSFSTVDSYNTGSIGYTIQSPVEDAYLKDLELVFTQVGSELYVTLHSTSFPKSNSSNYFNLLGTDIIEWTEGTVLLNSSKDYTDIVKGGKELGRVKLNTPSSSAKVNCTDHLPVYDENNEPVEIEPRIYTNEELAKLDYPTINEVPFIAKKGMSIGSPNGDNARNITIPAKHSGPTKTEAGGHDWEVLNDLRISSYEFSPGRVYKGGRKSNGKFLSTDSRVIENNSPTSKKYGLCKLGDFSQLNNTFNDYESAVELAKDWIDNIGPNDTDVVTVGMFRTFAYYLLNQIFENIETKGTTEISYTPWVIETNQSVVETQPNTTTDVDITVTATRTKITKYYVDGVEDVSKRINETETAYPDQIEVISEDGYKVAYSSVDKNWTVTIPSNNTEKNIKRYITVYVDRYKSSERSEILSVINKGFTNQVVSETFSISQFNTPKTVGFKSSTYDINFCVTVSHNMTDGSQIKSIYDGRDVVVTCDDGDVSIVYSDNGVYKVTYPDNYRPATKVYTLTCSFRNETKTIRVVQSNQTEENVVIGNKNFFNITPKTISFGSNPESSKILTTISYLGELWSFGDITIVKELPYTITCPEWISYNNTNSREITIIASENKGKARNGVIAVSQGTRTIEIPVNQSKAEEITLVDETVSVSQFYMDRSELPMGESTRELTVSYKITKEYSDGSILTEFYNGNDINVSVESEGAETNPEVASNGNGSWNIKFKALSTGKATFYIKSEYKGIASEIIVLTQGKFIKNSVYEFGISSSGEVLSGINKNIKPSGSSETIEFISKATDYYNDGTTYEHTLVPFSIVSFPEFVTSVKITGNTLSFEVPESFQDDKRFGNIVVKQNYSGKVISIHLSQDPCFRESFIYFNNDTKLLNGNQYNIKFESELASNIYRITPKYTVNSVTKEDNYNKITVSGGSSWLQYSYSLGMLTLQCSDNSSGAERTCNIILSYSNKVEALLVVTQEAGQPYITIEEIKGTSVYAISKSKDYQTFNLSIESNYPINISKESTWAEILTGYNYPAGVSNITFELMENSSALSRTASFMITAGTLSRLITITQTSKTYYVNVSGFENQDMHVCTSEWMNTLVIPLKCNVYFTIDYVSEWLNVAIDNTSTNTNPFHDDCNFYCNTQKPTIDQYLYISQKYPTSSGDKVGVVSMSIYDSTTATLVAIRKIYVTNLANSTLETIYGNSGDGYQILPFGPRNLFISGESNKVSLYAYSKESLYKVKILSSSDSSLEKELIQSEISGTPQGDKGLTSISVIIPENTSKKYRDITYTLVPSDMIDTDIPGNFPTPIYHIYQYPKIKLELKKYEYNVTDLGQETLMISAKTLNSCSGHFELKNNELPGWISLRRSTVSSANFILFKIEPNNSLETRECVLDFWCDSNISTLNRVTITQTGRDTLSSIPTEINVVDKSLICATSTESYFYVYNANSITDKAFTIDTEGKIVDTGISVKIETTDVNGKYKITYKKTTQNKLYDRDYIYGLVISRKDSTSSLVVIKNPRTSSTPIDITQGTIGFNGSNGSSASISTNINSNVGLTSFVQSTNFDINKYPNSCDFTTKDVSSKANNTEYLFTNLYNPEKRFLRKQVMDNIVFRNMDIVPGLAKEVGVTIPELNLPNRGIGAWDKSGNEIFSISNTKSESYEIYLDSNSLDSEGNKLVTTINFRAYDGVTISTSGTGFDFTNYTPDIVKKVGSIGKQTFSVSAKSDNTGSSQLSLGTVKLSLINGIVKTFYIYQKSNSINLIGNTWMTSLDKIATEENAPYESVQCFDDKNAYVIYDTLGGEPYWNLTFQHTYQNWMIRRTSGTSSLMKFNENAYSELFGKGGNSGTSVTTCDKGYESSVRLDAPSGGYSQDVNSLDIHQHDLYRISSTYSTGNITDESSEKGYIHVCTRPQRPGVSVYNSLNRLISETDKSGSGGVLSVIQTKSEDGGYIDASFTFRLRSNYIDITKEHIGEDVKVNGELVNIETEYDIFRGLISELSFEYNTNSTTDPQTISLSTANFSTGSVNGNSYMQFNCNLRINSSDYIKTANLKIVLNDFVSDPQYYKPYVSRTLITPLTVLIPEEGEEI